MKVLVIPEDPTLDLYILKPVVERLMAEVGRPRATVKVLERPRMRGVSEALRREKLDEILETFPQFALYRVLVDRDGVLDRVQLARARESEHPDRLLVALAVEEVEVWMLALHADELGAPWIDVRAELKPKVMYAEPLLVAHFEADSPGRGRKAAMRALDQGWNSLLRRCPELAELRDRLPDMLNR